MDARVTSRPDEALLDELRAFAAVHGRAPKQREVRGASTYEKRFGGWNASLEAAGLPINRRAHHRKSKQRRGEEELLAELREFYETHGRTPMRRDVSGGGQSHSRAFGTWLGAIDAAGLPRIGRRTVRSTRPKRQAGPLPHGLRREHYHDCRRPPDGRCTCPVRATLRLNGARESRVFGTFDEAMRWQSERRRAMTAGLARSGASKDVEAAYRAWRKAQAALASAAENAIRPEVRASLDDALSKSYAVEDALSAAVVAFVRA